MNGVNLPAPPIPIDRELMFLLDKIKRNRNIDFSQYQTHTLKNRIQNRLHVTNCHSYWDYILLLNKEPEEYDLLINSLTIKVSSFFRNTKTFELLRNSVIPEIISYKQAQGCKRICAWSCGAALGQEAYSMAILFCEALANHLNDYDLNILATDIDQQTLKKAPWVAYDKKALSDIKPYLLFKYFTRTGESYAVSDRLRSMITFKCHDVTSNNQRSGMDLILCRNLLIYFQKGLQERVLNNLYAALNPHGFLVLGKAESLASSLNGLLEVVDVGERVFQKGGGYFPSP
ncbi:MAG: protein-glutamate O-methyltransferase CheR [Candidatus Desantisbacteria bacterium]